MRNQKNDYDKIEKFLKSNKFAFETGSDDGITCFIKINFTDDGKAGGYKKPKSGPKQTKGSVPRSRN